MNCEQTITSTSATLKKRVEAVLDMAVTTISSLSESFTSGVPLEGDEAVPAEDDRMKKDSHSANDEQMHTTNGSFTDREAGPQASGGTSANTMQGLPSSGAEVAGAEGNAEAEPKGASDNAPSLSANNAAEDKQDGDDSDSASDDDAILQVHG